MSSRVTHWLRLLASAAATVALALLLLADSADDGNEDVDGGCEYAAFTGEFDYSSTCPLEGSGGALNVGTPTGHVSLNLASSSSTSAGYDALAAFNAAGLNAFRAEVHYDSCSRNQLPAAVEGVTIAVGRRSLSEFQCTRLALPMSLPQTVTCTQIIDAGAQPATCAITFSPPPG